MATYTVTTMTHTAEGAPRLEGIEFEAKTMDYKEVGDYGVFVEFYDEHGDLVEAFESAAVRRISREQ